jgi:hypothetical protein
MALIRETSRIYLFLVLFKLTGADVPYRPNTYWKNKMDEYWNKYERTSTPFGECCKYIRTIRTLVIKFMFNEV